MQEFRVKAREELLLIMLDTKGKLLQDSIISSGTINYSILDPREVFVTAFQYHAVQIILLHNHPSGDPTPSKEDIFATQKIKQAGEIVGIELIDHIIIGDNRYISMREKNLF
jgi:DNA repair protein RadC